MATTPAEMVTAIDTALASIVADPKASRTFNGRSFTYQNLRELRELRNYYQGLANASTVAGGTKRPIKMFGIRMRDPE